MNEMPSRFPPPWWIDELRGCLVVRDHNGRALGYFYYGSHSNHCAESDALREEEARRVATSFAKLPELLLKAPQQLRQYSDADPMWVGILSAICLISALGSTLLLAGW